MGVQHGSGRPVAMGSWKPEQEASEEQVCAAFTTFAPSWMRAVEPFQRGAVPRQIRLTLHCNAALQLPNQT